MLHDDLLQHPGVKGLAQIGRNALERIAELERQMGDLAMLVSRLSAALKKVAPEHQLLPRAIEYLKKINHPSGVLRTPLALD